MSTTDLSVKQVRVIVHAGFHKTGTSSLQGYFWLNQKALTEHLTFYTRRSFRKSGNLAHRYGIAPYFFNRFLFAWAFRTFLNYIPDAPVIIISWECFSGVMPGHRRNFTGPIMSYSRAAKPLAETIIHELRHRFSDDVRIEFLYTTRERNAWLKSVHGHLLRSIRLTKDLDSFKKFHSETPDPDEEAQIMADFLHPVPVHKAALEDSFGNRFGPAAAIFDLVDIPSVVLEKLPDAVHKNKASSPELEEKFLSLNRTIRSKPVLKKAKEKLLKRKRASKK